MSVKFFQSLVNQIKNIVDIEFGIMDETGLVLGCTDDKKVGQTNNKIKLLSDIKETFIIKDGVTYQKVNIKNKLEIITFINSETNESKKILQLISIHAQNMKTYYDEKYDKFNFVKNILMDNVLPGDIPIRAKELRLENGGYRVVFLIKSKKVSDFSVYEVLYSMFPNRAKDFVVMLGDEYTALIKEVKSNDNLKEINSIAKTIIEKFKVELKVNIRIGIGTAVETIKDLGRAYKEAQMALLIGGIFDNDKNIINYNNLGIGRLIYQLPRTLCKLFLSEVFKDDFFDSLDKESLTTVEKFFENNLNVSETARQLYVHRNTLVYRLDKIEKLTGLDLRLFDHAIIFKVAMLVKKYLDNGERLR